MPKRKNENANNSLLSLAKHIHWQYGGKTLLGKHEDILSVVQIGKWLWPLGKVKLLGCACILLSFQM